MGHLHIFIPPRESDLQHPFAIECRLSVLDNEYVIRTSSDDLGLNNRCRTNGYMMVVLRIWQCRNLRFPHKLRASL